MRQLPISKGLAMAYKRTTFSLVALILTFGLPALADDRQYIEALDALVVHGTHGVSNLRLDTGTQFECEESRHQQIQSRVCKVRDASLTIAEHPEQQFVVESSRYRRTYLSYSDRWVVSHYFIGKWQRTVGDQVITSAFSLGVFYKEADADKFSGDLHLADLDITEALSIQNIQFSTGSDSPQSK